MEVQPFFVRKRQTKKGRLLLGTAWVVASPVSEWRSFFR